MILIVGCGFLGSHILKHISAKTHEPIIATVRNKATAPDIENVKFIECDVTDKDDVSALFKECEGHTLTVFYLAACHNIDYVYENPSEARKVNIDALVSFLSRLNKNDKLFFASTDCVYGDSDTVNFSEDSALNPVNEYGRQKAEAEKFVTDKGFTALRLPFMLGKSLTEKNHFYDNICKNLKENKPTEMIDGMKRSLLSYSQVAELVYNISLLPKEKLPPVINVCGDSTIGKYEMGCIIAESIGAPEKLIKKITEEEGSKFFKDKRARCTAMDNSLLKSLTGLQKIDWKV